MKRLLPLSTWLGSPRAWASQNTEPQAVKQADQALSQASDGLQRQLSSAWKEEWLWGLERWQWMALLILGAIIALTTFALTRLTRRFIQRASAEQSVSQQSFIAQLLRNTAGPMALGWAALLSRVALPLLDFSTKAEIHWQRAFHIALATSFFWGSLRGLGTVNEHFVRSTLAQTRPGSRALIGLLSRVARFILAGLAILGVLTELGYSVGSVLAGLGIGGIALALGAQKTLENVFGAFALAVDQPIREGDFVRVENTTGTVENIGLRSTRIRTLERTVVSIPNGKLADMRLETFAPRDRIRFTANFGLKANTAAAQVKDVLARCDAILKAQPKLWPEGASVHLVKISEASQEIEVAAWFSTANFDEFCAIRDDVLLAILEALEAAQVQLATPSSRLP